jgi:SAM-dependent methyltransferase
MKKQIKFQNRYFENRYFNIFYKKIFYDKYFRKNKIYKILFLFLIILFFLIFFLFSFILKKNKNEYFTQNENNINNIENEYSEKYAEIYNRIFDNKTIPENDIKNIIAILNPNESDKFLDVGTGVGNHYKFINYDTIGVDRSNAFLKYAKINNPLGTFKNGDVINNNLFKKEQFNHIFCLQDTFYHNSNTNMEKIISNFKNWLKPDGTICIHLFNNEKLDPSPRTFSILSHRKSGELQATTKFKEFDHIAYWDKTDYCEKIIFHKTKKVFEKCHKMNIPDEKVLIKMFLDKGFVIDNIVDLISLNMNTCNIYIFKCGGENKK